MSEALALSSLFRRLFSRCNCDTSRVAKISYAQLSARPGARRYNALGGTRPWTGAVRLAASYSKKQAKVPAGGVMWQPRFDFIPAERTTEFSKYAMVTAEDLARKSRRPRRTKMLMRDFIDDSLYNPHYGYFPRQVVIFNSGKPFDFNSFKDEADFHNALGKRYTSFEDGLDESKPDDTRQLWHTPTELFRPYYAESIARYMVANYRLTGYPYNDLIIYEMGAGNGTFMLNVLDHIRETDEEVYARTKYRVIEISAALAGIQKSALGAALASHADKVEIINSSIFSWDTYVSSPCFFLALEVIDNFAHDIIRYDHRTNTPMQGIVLIDEEGEFFQFYSPQIDPVASRYLRVRNAACPDLPYSHPLNLSKWRRHIRSKLPFAPNLSEPEWIPTRLMMFFDILHKYFPAHRLLLSDFSSLPNATAGLNAPVVQTRYKRQTVPVTTPLVHQGYFDILFPTDFETTEGIYRALTGRFTQVMSHADFIQRWADVGQTQCVNGENPLLTWYHNAKFMVTI